MAHGIKIDNRDQIFIIEARMVIKSEKNIAIVSCILGVLSVIYGMIKGNDVLFMVGLVFVVGGYLMIRHKLKGHAKREIR